MSVQNTVFNHFYRKCYNDGVMEFIDILMEAAHESLGKDQQEAIMFANANINRYWNQLKAKQDVDVKKNIRPIFGIVDERLKRVIWSPNADYPTQSKQILLKALYKSRPYILSKIDSLSDRQYEALACLACKLLGADNYFLTPAGNEGGIDFLATIKFPYNAHFLIGINGPIRLVGQCKQYTSKVSVDKLRDFITVLDHVKNHYRTVEKYIPSWFKLSKGPIIGWIVAHSGFQSGVESMARDHGIILSDSRDITEIITKSTKFFCNMSPGSRSTEIVNCVDKIILEEDFQTC
ncbi:restriction endonuclease [Paenibacillus oryzisoli]|uniref:restriction endonuclease n=1 Tax=Paenibacillus oryzisoli TaxID=1850517 RepID=UPI003D27332C